MSKKVKPFHVSIVNQLKAAEEKLSKNKSIGLFVSRFVTEVKTITTTIITTDVPEDLLPKLISDLEFFYQEFEAKYPRKEDACGGKRERAFIDEYFTDTIASLSERLPVIEPETVVVTEEVNA